MTVEKAKPIGAISERKDGRYKKVSPDEWVKVTDEKREKQEPVKSKFPDHTGDPKYNKLADESLSNINEKSINALYRYMESSFETNRQLRRDRDIGRGREIALLDKAFEEAPINGKDIPYLYRSAVIDKDLIEGLELGDSFSDKGFVSTSANKGQASEFLDMAMDFAEPNEQAVFFTFHNGDGQFKALPLANLNEDFAFQKEILLNRDSKLRLINKRWNGDHWSLSVVIENA